MISLRTIKPRRLMTIAALVAMLATALLRHADAAFTGAPMHATVRLQRIRLEAPTLPPLAHVRFCLQYPRECRRTAILFRGGRVKLTPLRLRELTAVNMRVNAAITPERDPPGVVNERWRLAPSSGSCHDYAVTKRHELIVHGWPARSLLLSEVVTSWGEHHLVLVVRTAIADLVLDNLDAEIKPWTDTSYQWLRIETPQNPMVWANVHKDGARHFAMRLSAHQRHASWPARSQARWRQPVREASWAVPL